jgi:N-acetylmuramoyl-L-alanine amidase
MGAEPVRRFADAAPTYRVRCYLTLLGPTLAWWWAFCLTVLLLPAAEAAPERFPATAGLGTFVIGGAHYVDAHAFLARSGLERSWMVPGRKARFASRMVTVELEADTRETTFNGLRLLLGDPTVLHRNGLWISRLDAEKLLGPLLRPELYGPTGRLPKLIVIDAGHGGKDTGTRNERLGLDEKALALDVARRLAALLEKEGYRVLMTRTDDTFIPLGERAEFANRAKADLFISIHFNSVHGSPAVRGAETFILTPQYQRSTSAQKSDEGDRVEQAGNVADPWNAVLGFQIQRQLLNRLGTVDRGLRRARFAVLRLVECPAVLVEAGYLSNDEEARKIATPEYRSAIAEAIATGIAGYSAQVAAAKKPR